MNRQQGRGIFALATAPQRSALHLIRVSGWGLRHLCDLFRGKTLTPETLFLNSPRATVHYGEVLDEKGNVLDDVVVMTFPAPHSFTGEEVLEISCHGNPLISQAIQNLFRSQGLEEAQPGAFSFLSYLNGKMGLPEAERLSHLMEARTLSAIQLFSREAQKRLEVQFQKLSESFDELLCLLESAIDFEEDVGHLESDTFRLSWQKLCKEIEKLLGEFEWSQREEVGLHLGLMGAPNVGKSSLFNALLKKEAALVTDRPGTTRDLLSAQQIVKGQLWTWYDTAGVQETSDEIEQMGIQKALDFAPSLSLRFLVTDKWQEGFENLKKELDLFQKKIGKVDVMVLSKVDEPFSQFFWEDLQKKFDLPLFPVSVHSEEGFQNFLQLLEGFLRKAPPPLSWGVTNRQAALLQQSLSVLQRVEQELGLTFPEILVEQLQEVRLWLQELIGKGDQERIYDLIFSRFCIGK